MSELVMRQLAMLSAIPKGAPGVSTADIESALEEKGFSISRRSIQRDLEKLSSVYPLVCDACGRTNYWYYTLSSDPVLIPRMDLNTALTLKLVQQHLQPLLPQKVRSFLAGYFPEADKVLAHDTTRLQLWLDRTRVIAQGLPQQAPEIIQDVWDVLTQAVVDQSMCEVAYHPHRREAAKTYRISPLGIVIRGPVTYLLAVYEGYSDIRQMAMHRFVQARALHDQAQIPEGFCLDRYIEAGHFGVLEDTTPRSLELDVSAPVLRLLREAPLSKDQQVVQTPSGTLVRCQVPESAELYRWLVAHASDVRVVTPPDIRKRLVQRLKSGLERQLKRTDSYELV